jgi:hypothetical protein
MSSATWTMTQDLETHWWSSVDCEHGATRSGLWLQRAVVDDRNFLALAPQTFANHQALHEDCDCALVLGYTPSYVPDLS